MRVPDELVEAVAEAFHNEREYREPGGERYGDPADESAPREPFLWEQMVAEGKYEGDQDEYRKDARAALQAVLPKVRERLKATTPYSDEMKEAIDYAFDHAFPEGSA